MNAVEMFKIISHHHCNNWNRFCTRAQVIAKASSV